MFAPKMITFACMTISSTSRSRGVELGFYRFLIKPKSKTRKPCCRKETARCCSCSFRFKVRRWL